MEEILSQEEVAHESAPEPTTETTTETGNKRKRGERGLNQFPKVTYRVTDVSATGQPLAPAETLPKWRNTLGFLVRDHLDITVREWKNVDNNEITRMWNRLLTRFVLPQGSEDLVKEHTLKQWGIMFRNYKSELNSKWAKKGLDPTKRYKITAGQWAVFLEQRNSDEFKALSESKSELAKRNKYHHHLGTGGYQRKLAQWEQEDEAQRAQGLPALPDQLGRRGSQWVHARVPAKKANSSLSFADPMVEEAAKNIFKVAAKQKAGEFKPQREKDVLTVALGNPEHPGRVRGISSKEGWKEGFGPEWEGMYRKRDRYKEELSNFFKEEAKKEVEQVMNKMLSDPPPELMQRLASAMSSQLSGQPRQMQLVVAPTTSQQAPVVPSSVASTGNKDRYPVDEIESPVRCSLVIRYGLNNNRTREVATGLAIPGRQFHGSEIPEDYCRVEVQTVVQGYEDDMLDIPGPEGIEKLGQAIKNFILWPRRDVLLSEVPQPSSQEVPLTQESSLPDVGGNITLPSLPPSPIFAPPSSPIMPHPPSPPPSPKPQPSPAPPESSTPPPPKNAETPPQPTKDDETTPPPPKKLKFSVPKLVSPFEPKKRKSAGTALFLSGIAMSRTTKLVDLAEHEKAAKKSEPAFVNIRPPTKDDYKYVPKKYELGRPLLTWDKLKKVPAGVKRFHDWYMRAASVGIDTISVDIPVEAFNSDHTRAIVTFEDMWLMMNLQRLDVQLITVFAL
jgi:hypothetical protein